MINVGKLSIREKVGVILPLLTLLTVITTTIVDGYTILDPTWSYKTDDCVNSIAISSDGNYIVAGGDDYRVYFFDKSGNLLWYYWVYDYVSSVDISADGKYIVVGCEDEYTYDEYDYTIYLFDKNGNLLWGYKTKDSVNVVKITPDGEYIIAGDDSGYYYFFNKNGELIWKYNTGTSSDIASVAISSNGQRVIGECNGYLWYFDKCTSFGTVTLSWVYQEDSINKVGMSSDGEIVVATGDHKVYIFDKYGNVKHSCDTDDWVVPIEISSDGEYIVAGGGSNKIYFIDKNGKLLWKKTLGSGDGYIKSLAISSDGQYVVVGSTDSSVYFLDKYGNILWSYKTERRVLSVDLSDDGRTIVAGSNDHKVYYFTFTPPSTGILKVSSDPSGAKVYINYEFKGYTPLELELPPGTYTVSVEKEGYDTYTTEVSLNAGDVKTITANLEPLVGYVSITSNVDNAEVYIDGKYVGHTPIENYKLSVGTHEIKVAKNGYRDFIDTINIEAGKTLEVYAELISENATLEIISSPSDAKVYINDRYYGKTPLTVELPAGTYTISVKKEGYETYTETITLRAGDARTIEITLESESGVLRVETNPSGADVYVNGEYYDTTPCEITLPVGTYTVEIKKEGYKTYKKDVKIKAKETTILEVTLTPVDQKATLDVTSNPSGAEVYINGEKKGKTPLTLYLPPDEYTIKIKKEGYTTFIKRITLSSGQYLSINAELVKENGTLHVDSEPSEAYVYVDGQLVGRTPLEVALPVGEHTIVVKKEGYETYTKVVTISVGETVDIHIQLTQLVTESAKKPPVAKITGRTVVYEGHEVELSGLKSYDPDGKIVSYQWIDENGVVISTEPILREIFPVGRHKITLEVMDDDGLTSKDTVTITVLQKLDKKPEISANIKEMHYETTYEGLLTLSIANTGDADAYNVIVTIEIPSGVVIHYADGVYEAGSLTLWHTNVLRAGDQHTINLGFKLVEVDSALIVGTIKYKDSEGKEYKIPVELPIKSKKTSTVITRTLAPTITKQIPNFTIITGVISILLAIAVRRHY